jgi:tRNA-dihydrouridine synthase B
MANLAARPINQVIKVGDVDVPGRAALAPLAGYTEYPFRATVAGFGCPYAVTPLISAEGLARRNENTLRLLATGPDDAPVVAAQIFGSAPGAMAEAAKVAADAGFPLVDVNVGCPARKIRKQSAGAALLGDVATLRRIARAVVAASPVPVTAKMRPGATAADKRGPEAAKILAEEGVAALSVHGRYADQRFGGPVDYAAIAEVVDAVDVPVWANGGVRTAGDAADLLERTGAAGVMVGRGAVRRPYLIKEIETYLATGAEAGPPARAELAAAVRSHFDRAAALDGEERAARQFRKHLLAYLKGAGAPKELRARAAHVARRADVVAVLEEFRRSPSDGA